MPLPNSTKTALTHDLHGTQSNQQRVLHSPLTHMQPALFIPAVPLTAPHFCIFQPRTPMTFDLHIQESTFIYLDV